MILHSGVIRAILLSVWTPLESALCSGLDWTNGPAHTWQTRTDWTEKGTELFIRKELSQKQGKLGNITVIIRFITVIESTAVITMGDVKDQSVGIILK